MKKTIFILLMAVISPLCVVSNRNGGPLAQVSSGLRPPTALCVVSNYARVSSGLRPPTALCVVSNYARVSSGLRPPTQTSNEEAIKKVIVAEFEAYLNRDFQAWVNAYVDSPQNVYMITPGRSAGQLVYRTGFQNMKAASEALFKTPIKGQFDIIDRKDWNFRILGNVAWVSYKSTFKIGEDLIPAAELKVFEKIDGQWKISATATIGDYKNATPPVPSKY